MCLFEYAMGLTQASEPASKHGALFLILTTAMGPTIEGQTSDDGRTAY